jgi:opacity protein-like surface antigen
VALGIHAPGPFQIELSAIMLGPTSTMFGSDPRYGTSGYAMRSTIRTSSALMLSGLWHALQVGRWNWHLEGGFGYAHHRYRLDYWQPTGITQKNRRESGIAYQIGTGLRYHATDTIFWQLGYRFMQMGKINVPGWMIDPHLISRDYRLTSHQISVSLGIRW